MNPRTTKEPAAVEGARWIALTKDRFALVDSEDFEALNIHSWQCEVRNKTCYARNSQFVYMHRLLCKGVAIDHIDGNGLNNRRYNLRPSTKSTNGANRKHKNANNISGFKGVSWDSNRGLWYVQIMIKRKKIHLGRFKTIEEAARTYDKKAKELFGEFATLNYPED